MATREMRVLEIAMVALAGCMLLSQPVWAASGNMAGAGKHYYMRYCAPWHVAQ